MRFNLNWKPFKLFYGWVIVGTCFFIALYVGGVINYGFTAFFEPIANEFGWTYTQISFAASLRSLELGLFAPFTGILVDRWGPRRLVFSGVVITSLALILLSQTASLHMFYGAFILMAIGVSACASTGLMTAVTNWFRKKIGIASGIVACGYGFSGLLILAIVKLIDMYGWRMAVDVLGIGMLVICLPLSLLVRHRPEQYGYLPDGEVGSISTLSEALDSAQTVDVNFKPKQALKSRSFWRIALVLASQHMIVNAVVTHVMPYLGTVSIARTKSKLVASAIPLMSIVGRLGLGWLGDRFDKRRLMASAFAMMVFGLLCFGCTSAIDTWLLVPFLILFGIGYGGISALRPSLVREFFGRSNFGTIFGFIMGIMMLGGITGPLLAGYAFDNWGSYKVIWFVFADLAAAAGLLIATTSPM